MILSVGAGLAAAAVALADDDDQDRALRARQAGEIAPLDEILQEVDQHYHGTVVEVELEQEDGRWIYEVELVAADGRLLEIRLDAKTKVLLSQGRQ